MVACYDCFLHNPLPVLHTTESYVGARFRGLFIEAGSQHDGAVMRHAFVLCL
jgi:hypothetical protein